MTCFTNCINTGIVYHEVEIIIDVISYGKTADYSACLFTPMGQGHQKVKASAGFHLIWLKINSTYVTQKYTCFRHNYWIC